MSCIDAIVAAVDRAFRSAPSLFEAQTCRSGCSARIASGLQTLCAETTRVTDICLSTQLYVSRCLDQVPSVERVAMS